MSHSIDKKDEYADVGVASVSFLSSDYLEYDHKKNTIRATGNVSVVMDGTYIDANEVTYDVSKKIVLAYGSVILTTSKDNKISNLKSYATYVIYDLRTREVFINGAGMLLDDTGVMTAGFVGKQDNEHYDAVCIAYTACSIKPGQKPIWKLRAASTEIDLNQEKVVYRNVYFDVFGHTVLYTPYFSHPTPNARSKSGILTPIVADKGVSVPLYYAAKSNLDFTLTPRLMMHGYILEGEVRHLLAAGQYNINASYSPMNLKYSDLAVTKSIHRYHINTYGDFKDDNVYYGYKVERTSDPAYLKNFYHDYRNYLTSNTYVARYDNTDYIVVNNFIFQDLKTVGHPYNRNTIASPDVIWKKTIPIDSNTDAVIVNNFVNYANANSINITRHNILATITRRWYAANISGDVKLYYRNDIYNVIDHNSNVSTSRALFSRGIPELHSSAEVPFIVRNSSKFFVISPKISVIASGKRFINQSKYGYIDGYSSSVNEINLFSSNHYSGLDYHEYGNRMSYGISTRIRNTYNNGTVYWNMFVGQLIMQNSNSLKTPSHYVGKIQFSYNDALNVYYRFKRKNKSFAPYTDVVIVKLKHDKLTLTEECSIIRRSSYDNNSYIDGYQLTKTIKQNYMHLSYQLNSKVNIFGGVRTDFSKSIKILEYQMGVLYDFDCVNMRIYTAKYGVADEKRGIKKNTTWGVAVKLKTIM